MIRSITFKEILLSVLLILSIIGLLNPYDIFMPSMFHMMLLGLFVIFVGLFAGLVVHENVFDEREQTHRDRAGRLGYTLGLLVLALGITVQTLLEQPLDPWLLLGLGVMVLAKICSRVWSRIHG